MARKSPIDRCVQLALVPRAQRDWLTCLVVMDRLLDCAEVQRAIADHGGSLLDVREAVRPVTAESRNEHSRVAPWRGRRSYFDGELSSALSAVMPNARKQQVPVSGPVLVQAMLAASPSLAERVASFGIQPSWFDGTPDD